LKLFLQLGLPALQQQKSSLHFLAVSLLANKPDTGSVAHFQVIFQTGPPAVLEDRVFTGSDLEGSGNKGHYFSGVIGWTEWPEIFSPIIFYPAGESYSGKVFINSQLQERKTFVIF
jgi:hypothetical protein